MDRTNVNLIRALAEIKLKHDQNKMDVQGVSMEPLIYEGDVLYIEKRASYDIGDIVVIVDSAARLLVHRVIYIKDDKLITKGDNAIGSEEAEFSNCLGIITKIFPLSSKSSSSKKEIDPDFSPFITHIIVWLSRRMNNKFKAEVPGEKIFNGWERKIIKFLLRLKRPCSVSLSP